MLSLLIVIYLFYSTSTAFPLSPFQRDKPLSSTPDKFITSASPSEYGTRSTLNIFWSCLATLFACAWVAVHPNIPPNGCKYRERAKCLFVSLFSPELMVAWAIAQWYSARKILRELDSVDSESKWTLTHAHFLQMGGFVLYKDGRPTNVLVRSFPDILHYRSILSKIHISKEEILDRSKNDPLSKGLALLQTTWFVIQCIVRWAKGLFVTEMELATLAFAVLNGFMYFFWWDKPFNVGLPLPVHVLEDESVIVGNLTTSFKIEESADDENNEEDSPLLGSDNLSSNGADIQEDKIEPVPTEIKPSKMSMIWSAFSFIMRRKLLPQFCHISELIKESRILLQTNITFATFLYRTGFFYDSFFNLGEFQDPLAVPTFDASFFDDESDAGFTAFAVFAFVFGGIHCIGWILLHFRTSAEMIIWGSCSIHLCTFPLVMFIHRWFDFFPWEDLRFLRPFFVRHRHLSRRIASFFNRLEGIGFLLYVLARTMLSIEPFVGLRDLPPEALATVKWSSSFFPHV